MPGIELGQAQTPLAKKEWGLAPEQWPKMCWQIAA